MGTIICKKCNKVLGVVEARDHVCDVSPAAIARASAKLAKLKAQYDAFHVQASNLYHTEIAPLVDFIEAAEAANRASVATSSQPPALISTASSAVVDPPPEPNEVR